VIRDVLDEPCDCCGRWPSRLAIVGDGSTWRIRCGYGTRLERIVDDSSEISEPPPTPTAEELRTLDFIRRVLEESQPAARTLVETYLHSRGIGIVPVVLRFAPKLRHAPSGLSLPAMLAPVVDVQGEIVGLHRTFLAAGGSGKADVSPNKMMLGRCARGAVRLGESGDELVIGEGLESSLTVMEATRRPTWASLSASGMRAVELPPLPLAAHVVIAADHDPAGLAAAERLAERLFSEGRHVRIAKPPTPGQDFNDLGRGVA
jgi:Toprim domain